MICNSCKTENPSSAKFCMECSTSFLQTENSYSSGNITEEQYRMLLTHSPWAIAVYSTINNGKDFIFKDFNHKAEKLEGVKKEDILGKNVVDVFPGVIDLGLHNVFKRVWETGIPERLDSKLYIDVKTTAWRENYVYKLSNGDIISTYEDLSEKITAFKKIQETQTLFQTIFEKSNLGIICINSERKIILTNPAFQKMVNYTNDELTKFKLEDITYIEDLQLTKQISTKIFKESSDISTHEKRYVSKNGNVIWVHLTSSIVTNDKGKPLYAFAMVNDITEKKELETKLLDSKINLENLVKEKTEKLEHSLEELSDKKAIIDSINLIFKETLTCETIQEVASVCLNEAEKLTKSKFGFIMQLNEKDTADSIAMSNPGWNECCIKNPLKLINNMILKGIWSIPIIENKSIIWDNNDKKKLLINLPKGHPTITSFLSVPLRNNDKIIGSIAIANKKGGYQTKDLEIIELLSIAFSECLDRKNKDDKLKCQNIQLREANQHKNRFLSTMSHELRTPLNAILGLSQSLQKEYFGPLNQKQLEYLDLIYASGKHLLCLINDILDIAKIDAGSMELINENFDIISLINELASLMNTQFEEKYIDLTIKSDLKKLFIFADKKKNKQTLLNLLTNALKYTQEKGNVDIVITKEEEKVTISIIDTGLGIKENDLNKIFDEFYQSENTKTNAMGGTGIGLALCKRLVTLQGGEIGVESIESKGSTFWYTLPIKNSKKTVFK